MQTDNVDASFVLTPEQPSLPAKVSRATWAGLAIALFAMVAIRQAFVFFVPEPTFASAVLKEGLIWLSAIALIILIRRGEHLPMMQRVAKTARLINGMDRVPSVHLGPNPIEQACPGEALPTLDVTSAALDRRHRIIQIHIQAKLENLPRSRIVTSKRGVRLIVVMLLPVFGTKSSSLRRIIPSPRPNLALRLSYLWFRLMVIGH